MFPKQHKFEFSKDNLISSTDSIHRKEDRIINKEYTDPYRFEKKISDAYEKIESNLYTLNTLSGEASVKNQKGNIMIEDESERIFKEKYNYDENNKFKRKEEINVNNNIRFKNKTNLFEAISANFSMQNSNENTNYNDELVYYKEMIGKMHNEIENLNSKLGEMEKHNKSSYSSHNTPNFSTANFRNQKIDSIEKNIESLKDQFENNLKLKNDKLKQLEEERELLILKNEELNRENQNYRHSPGPSRTIQSKYNIYREDSLKRVNRLTDFSDNKSETTTFNRNRNKNLSLSQNNLESNSQINNNSSIYNNYDINSKKSRETTSLNVENSLENDYFKKRTIPNYKPIDNRLKTQDMKRKTKKDTLADERQRLRTPSVKNKIKKTPPKSFSKNKNTTPYRNSSTSSINSKNKSIIKNNSEMFDNLQKENEDLKLKITNLERNMNLMNTYSNDPIKGKNHLRLEMEIWRQRSETVAHNYLETINNMKKQLAQDKSTFVDQIKSLQNTFTNQVMELKNKYQSTLDKYEVNIRKLRKENGELKKKVLKVQEILLPSK
jgi:hypothetical protein